MLHSVVLMHDVIICTGYRHQPGKTSSEEKNVRKWQKPQKEQYRWDLSSRADSHEMDGECRENDLNQDNKNT